MGLEYEVFIQKVISKHTFLENFTYTSAFSRKLSEKISHIGRFFHVPKLEGFHGRVINFQAHIFTYPLAREGRFQIFQMLHIFGCKKFFEFAPNALFPHILNINYTPADLEIRHKNILRSRRVRIKIQVLTTLPGN